MRAAGACSAASGPVMQRTAPASCTTLKPLGAVFQPQQCARRFLGGFGSARMGPVVAVPPFAREAPGRPSPRPTHRPNHPSPRISAAAYEVSDVTEQASTVKEHRKGLYEEEYNPDYHNFVALTGSMMYKAWKGDKLTFLLFVKWQAAPEQAGAPHTYHHFYVEAGGDLARDVDTAMTDDLIVTVNGKLKARDDLGNHAFKIVATDVGIISNAPQGTAAPPEVVAAAGEQAAAAQQQATAAQPSPPPPAAAATARPGRPVPAAARKAAAATTGGGGGGDSGGQPQQKPAVGAAVGGGGAPAVSGIPDHPADDREAQWMELFKNPKGFFDNRSTKTNPKAPDFRQKNPGTIALWVEDRRTPQWVFNNLQHLPGNVPYTGTFKPSGGGRSSGSGSSAGAKQLDFLPAEASNEKEASWIDVFQNYKTYWDNRLNKLNPKAPDFKHKDNMVGTALWITSYDTPDWVKQNIEALPPPPPPRQ